METTLTTAGIRRSLLSGATTPEDEIVAAVERIAATDRTVRAWAHVDLEGAKAAAAALDRSRRAELPLWGVPLGIKDIIDVTGMPTRAGSALLRDAAPASSDAPVVARLRAAGAVILGKTVTQEFAYGVVSAPTTNPRNPLRIAGGSSGGSAAAVAAGHVAGAMGTDTAGSIRIPSALCGVVGLKPRNEALPLDRIIPLAPTFDVAGPMGRCVADVALLWEVLSGRHRPAVSPSDVWVLVAPLNTLPELEADVAAAYVDAIAILSRVARGTLRASIPAFADFDACRRDVLMGEALQVHRDRGWWPAQATRYSDETRGYLAWAETHVTAEDVAGARAECSRLGAQLQAACEDGHVIACPTVPCVAPTHAEAAVTDPGSPRRPIVSRLTRIPGPVNVAGLAALSVPSALTPDGLPVGIQLIGSDEDALLALGAAFEAARGVTV